jgi:hypothetical protein
MLQSLTAAERLACGGLITRQLGRWTMAGRVVDDYGIDGAAKLCSARVIGMYMLAVGTIMVCFAITGAVVIAVPCGIVMFLLWVMSISRVASAVRSRRRWRNAGHRVTD